jgi:raffinose/stachyose/melibiose transport system permease protein
MDIRKKSYPISYISIAFIVYTVFFIIPTISALFFSFTDWNINRFNTPQFNGIKNYVTLFTNEIFLKSLGNSLIFAFTTTILKTGIGLFFAVLLTKKVIGNSLFRTIFYIPCVLSPVIIGVLFSAILRPSGLFNNLLSLIGLAGLQQNWLSSYIPAMSWIIIIECWMWSGFCAFIFISGLQAIPQDYYEAAAIEGASKMKIFFTITIPLLVPSFTVVTTLNVTGGLKVFDLVYVITNGGPGFDTQVMSTYTYRAFGMGLLGESSAAAIILSLIVVVISFSLNKFLKNREVSM